MYCLRHGQTVFNLKGKIQGASDSPLTSLGIQQALAAQKYFKTNNIQFDTLYTSPQQRACGTLENAAPNQAYQRIKELKEWSFGLFEGESIELLRAIKEPKYLYGDAVVPFGGEARAEVENRVCNALEGVMKNNNGNNTLEVSHGSTIGLFIRKVLGYKKGSQYDIGNCNIVKFKYDDERFTFLEIIDPKK
ncbi:histidine phosphatase family protein [Staphylococcus saccharolyticus]|uniref:histidine phosphatase family protein n=1 Tax=Staphylococcus saccharolyticus TaxID=33028 RepID=UPI0016396F73|nr:histidine phosphatase family protein [Staphylococcus saccharolyticus]MBL7565686.1 histidine phosphatase family protein [Staphylococcus saccharolyticus]MBL7572232.1 histidine phosphatase family protein [Staphylococcus saccharolyticus]QQB99355.1 histidine phosphatase family protein [Staphylococcus saccharolyticus]QRJ67521.1 histidine phosphatase family protein [Staphylococcus saccharolyticus]